MSEQLLISRSKYIDPDTRMVLGQTSELMPFTMFIVYEKDAPEGATPIRFHGNYLSYDDGGNFDVTDENDLPHVVFEGFW